MWVIYYPLFLETEKKMKKKDHINFFFLIILITGKYKNRKPVILLSHLIDIYKKKVWLFDLFLCVCVCFLFFCFFFNFYIFIPQN